MHRNVVLSLILVGSAFGAGCDQRSSLASPGTAGSSAAGTSAGGSGAAGASGGASAAGVAGTSGGAYTVGAAGASGVAGTSGATATGAAGTGGGAGTAAPAYDGGVAGTSAPVGQDGGTSPAVDAGPVQGVQGWIDRTPQTLPSSWPSGRRQPAMAYDRTTKRVIMYGGSSGAQGVQDTWAWDGATGKWTLLVVPPPSVAFRTAATWNERDQSLMLFGGETLPNRAPSSDLWRYSGSWSLVAPSATSAAWPPVQVNALLAYDAARARLVLLGAGVSPPTWEYDLVAKSWTNRTPVDESPTNKMGVFAWDERRHVGVFFGNEGFGVVWEWDPVAGTWARKPHAGDQSPAPRRFSAAAYDSHAGRVVLFGGGFDDSPGSYGWTNDLWEWDGTSWTLLDSGPTPNAPGPREAHGLAYDSDRRCLVTFGGSTPDEDPEPRDLWEWHR